MQLDCLPVDVQRQIMHSIRDGLMGPNDPLNDLWEFETFCGLGGFTGPIHQPAFGVTLSQFIDERNCPDSDDLGNSWHHEEWSAPAIYSTSGGLEMTLLTYVGS